MAQTISTLGCKKGKGRERQLVDDAAPLPDEGADGAATALPSTHVVAIFLGRPRERVGGGSGFPSALRKEKAGVRKNRGGGGGRQSPSHRPRSPTSAPSLLEASPPPPTGTAMLLLLPVRMRSLKPAAGGSPAQEGAWFCERTPPPPLWKKGHVCRLYRRYRG